jgi:MORN repeat
MWGKGELLYKDGSKYSGDWWQNKMHGVGTLTKVNTLEIEYKG